MLHAYLLSKRLQKRASDLLKLELGRVVSSHIGAVNPTLVLLRNSKCC